MPSTRHSSFSVSPTCLWMASPTKVVAFTRIGAAASKLTAAVSSGPKLFIKVWIFWLEAVKSGKSLLLEEAGS